MFTEAISWAGDVMTAAGISNAADPADLNVPGVLLLPATAEDLTMDGVSTQVALTVYLVTASTGTINDLHNLEALTDRVRDAGIVLRDLTALTLTLPNHNLSGLPAFRSTITVTITRESPA